MTIGWIIVGVSALGSVRTRNGTRSRAQTASPEPRVESRRCTKTDTATPAMRQYLDAKRQYRDAIVFFRMGDFYEMFYEDALVAARALELTLTSRSKDAGGQWHPDVRRPLPCRGRLHRAAGQKGISRRDLRAGRGPQEGQGTGSARSRARGLAGNAHRCQLSRCTRAGISDGDCRPTGSREPVFGAALIDLSTGEFSAAEYHGASGLEALADEVAVLRPRELVVSTEQEKPTIVERLVALTRVEPAVTTAEGWTFEPEAARRALLDQLKTHGLEGFGLEGRTAAIQAAGALVTYLRDTQKADLAHVRAIGYRTSGDSLIIDPITLKHLEVVTGSEGGPKRIAPARDRSDDHVDGRTAAPRVAAASPVRARAHS